MDGKGQFTVKKLRAMGPYAQKEEVRGGKLRHAAHGGTSSEGIVARIVDSVRDVVHDLTHHDEHGTKKDGR